ncbi:MAG: fumarylacetoacetate hydrolase family protein [Chloroflexi bacterium]|nr:fumarylacetoacetate hydrolase family protein [Chloroflexota bacterium]
MRLFSFLADDGPAVGVLTDGDRVIRLTSVDGSLDLALAEGRMTALLREAAKVMSQAASGDRPSEAGDRPGYGSPVTELDPLPAIEFPGKVVCVGLNYADHVVEGGRPAPERPLLFAKFGNAVVGDGEPIVRPQGTHALDLEVELGVVIGKRARRVSAEEAPAHVAGYVVLNDVSARDWQGNPQALRAGEKGDGQWLRAKSSDTFLPVGPVLTTAEAFDPTAGHRIRSWRIPGGGPEAGTHIAMQDGTTADLIWTVPQLIEFISRQITLDPGDLIATGTPAGVGVFRDPPVFLEPGDRVRCEVEGIGMVENPVIDWSDAPPGLTDDID